MKKIVLILLMSTSLFAFEGAAAKALARFFSKETITLVSKQYGANGIRALERLSATHGKGALEVMKRYGAKYGDKGLKILAQYGEKAVANRASFEMVKRFGDKGFYLVRQFPQRATAYYEKYGDKFVTTANKVGNSRTITYLDAAAQHNADGKVLRFLEKFGEKGSLFLDRHWGKLLTSGFVLLNAESLIDSAKNVANHGLDKGGEMVEQSVKHVADSQLGWMIGLALLLFVFFKYGLEAIVRVWRRKETK